MARFSGKIGFATTVKVRPGVTDDVIVEKQYYGDVVVANRNLVPNQDSVNDNIEVGSSISVVADGYAHEHIFAMRYVKWQGVRWKVIDAQVERPRLLLRLGGVYNGPTPPAPSVA